MFDLFGKIEEWFHDLLAGFVSSNLTTMFTDVNAKTATIASEVGQTPQSWTSSIFSMIRSLSDSVIVPIAGMIITFVLCYELITMITERNNMHEMDTWMFFKWFFKSFVAVFLVTHTFDIVMGIFDIGQSIVCFTCSIRSFVILPPARLVSPMKPGLSALTVIWLPSSRSFLESSYVKYRLHSLE